MQSDEISRNKIGWKQPTQGNATAEPIEQTNLGWTHSKESRSSQYRTRNANSKNLRKGKSFGNSKSKSSYAMMQFASKHINIPLHIKNICQWFTSHGFFWFIVAFCAIAEPILCSKRPEGNYLLAQKIVLSISTVCFMIQLIGVASTEWESILSVEANPGMILPYSELVIQKMNHMTLLKIFIFFTAEGEYILEFGCLSMGWIFLFNNPGIAVLRCFRVFRLLWFYDLKVFKDAVHYCFDRFVGKDFVRRVFNIFKFAVKSLSALGNEMFRLTNATRGGLLLMAVFFYSAYVVGAALWVETGAPDNNCASLGDCMYTMMRLTFFDGTGFDYAYSLSYNNKFLFLVTMLYLCITAFGILNGLVGIFGNAFNKASEQSFHEIAEENDDSDSEIDEEEVRAYELYLSRHNKDGHNRGGNSSWRSRNESTNTPAEVDNTATLKTKDKPQGVSSMKSVLKRTLRFAVAKIHNRSFYFADSVRRAMWLSKHGVKVHQVAQKKLVGTYHSVKTRRASSGKIHPQNSSAASLQFQNHSVISESPPSHTGTSIHPETQSLINALHMHVGHLHSKVDSQCALMSQMFEQMSKLYLQIEHQERTRQHQHVQTIETLPRQELHPRNGIHTMRDEPRSNSNGNLSQSRAATSPQFIDVLPIRKPSYVKVDDNNNNNDNINNDNININIQQDEELIAASIAAIPTRKIKSHTSFAIESVWDGSDSPLTLSTANDMESVMSSDDLPEVNHRRPKSFNDGVYIGPPPASRQNLMPPISNSMPMEWMRPSTSSSSVSSYDYMPESVRAKMASMHQLLHSNNEV
mmetsp:Transcript_13341/g.18290  ORF Transcript_13341/g.18290 Transcript_13341/m.18290 type:complete len:806 (+) Transcript_13341:13-2430(+)